MTTDTPRAGSAELPATGTVHRLTAAPVTTTQLVKYAGASGDFNRIHFDEPFARSAGLDGLLVHGMLTMAFAGRCVTEMVSPALRIDELSARFLAPVKVGDAVEVEATVTESNGVVAHLDLAARVGETVVLRGAARVVQS